MSKGKGHIPRRTCISCRAKRNKKALVRLVLNADGTVVPDAGQKGLGRGAYVCADPSCMSGLQNIGRLKRAFRTQDIVSVHPRFDRMDVSVGSPEMGTQRVQGP